MCFTNHNNDTSPILLMITSKTDTNNASTGAPWVLHFPAWHSRVCDSSESHRPCSSSVAECSGLI